MYNSVKPKFSDAIKVLLVFSLIIVIIYQNSVIGDLTDRMNRIESEEKDINAITEEVQGFLYDFGDYLKEQDANIMNLYDSIEDTEDRIHDLESDVEYLRKENSQLKIDISYLSMQIFEVAINSSVTLSPPIVEPRKTPFRIGDTITWDIESDYPLEGAKITTWFPNGTLVWRTRELTDWIYRDGFWFVPYYAQQSDSEMMVFLEDFPLGNYTYSFTYEDIFEVMGTFEVLEAYEGVISDM